MGTNGSAETVCLLDKNDEGRFTNIDEGDVSSIDGKVVNLKEAFYIMVGLSLGTGILTIPFTIRQLGLLVWIFCFFGIIALQCLCTYILSICTQKMSEENNEVQRAMRDPYQAVAELSGGNILRKVSVEFMYATNMGGCVSLLLLAASLLVDYIPIGPFTNTNQIRIWVTVIIAVLTPIMYLSTYGDLKVPAVIAIVTSLMSAAAIIVNCMLKEYVYISKGDVTVPKPEKADQGYLIPLGTIIFVTSGAASSIANITVLASTPKKLIRSIFGCYVCICIVLLVTGLVPYFVFEENVTSSIMTTFNDVIKSNESTIVFKVITMAIQVLMLLHLTMASILSMNPCFLHLEEILDVPHELNWKRIIVRTSCMLIILGICMLIPEFEITTEITGGVTITFMGIFLPIFMYTRLFEMTIYKKTWIYLFLLVVLVFMLSYFIVSIINVVIT